MSGEEQGHREERQRRERRRREERAADEKESLPYSRLASIYDAVMGDVAYDMWVDYVEELCGRHGLAPRTVLDVACGTGSSTLPFAVRGYRVAGVDLSPDMLGIARAKATALGVGVEFARQDMRLLRPAALSAGPAFDLVICLYDSINYLTETTELVRALTGFHAAVRPGGLVILDVNAARRLSQMTETSIFLEGPGWAFIEQNAYDPPTAIWEITVTGFVRHRGDLFRRFREVHRERAYSEGEMRAALTAAGFTVRAAYSAFSLESADHETARIYFVAQRPAG